GGRAAMTGIGEKLGSIGQMAGRPLQDQILSRLVEASTYQATESGTNPGGTMKSTCITLARAAAIAVAAALAATTPSTSAAPTRSVAPQAATAPAATSLTLIGTVDPQHVYSAKTELVLYGVYAFDPSNVSFNQHVMPASIPQVAVPYVLVPDGNPHTYV